MKQTVSASEFMTMRNRYGLNENEMAVCFSVSSNTIKLWEEQSKATIQFKDHQKSVYQLLSSVDPMKGGFSSFLDIGKELKQKETYNEIVSFLAAHQSDFQT